MTDPRPSGLNGFTKWIMPVLLSSTIAMSGYIWHGLTKDLEVIKALAAERGPRIAVLEEQMRQVRETHAGIFRDIHELSTKIDVLLLRKERL